MLDEGFDIHDFDVLCQIDFYEFLFKQTWD